VIVTILNQHNDGHLASVAFVGKTLSESEKLYPIYEKMRLIVMFSCEQFISFLEHKQFIVHTDYEALSWMRHHTCQLGHTGRWILISPH
jgi:hypothetical protein